MKSLKAYALAGLMTCSLASRTFNIEYNNFSEKESVEITCAAQRSCGQSAFGQEKFCIDGTACRSSDFGDFCVSMSSIHCNRATSCKPDEVLDPTRYCSCMTSTERRNMFCGDSDTVDD